LIEQIAALVIHYSERKKLVDASFIEEVIAQVVSEKGLASYVKSFSTEMTLGEDMRGGYSYLYRRIEINLPYFYQIYYSKRITPWECLSANLIILRTLLEELYHAEQYQKAYSSQQDLEAILFRNDIEYFETLKNNDLLSIIRSVIYTVYLYDIAPTERMAKIDSTMSLIQVSEEIKKKTSSLVQTGFDAESYCYEQVFRQGYQESKKSPTERFLRVTQPDAWKNLPFYDECYPLLIEKANGLYSLEEKLRLGLPVTDKELKMPLSLSRIRK